MSDAPPTKGIFGLNSPGRVIALFVIGGLFAALLVAAVAGGLVSWKVPAIVGCGVGAIVAFVEGYRNRDA